MRAFRPETETEPLVFAFFRIVGFFHLERRRGQVLATRPLDEEYAIRVVYRFINDNILVVTFYPVKRKRFNV
jgi:hypothetical protein